ncbi:uncharacterized protein LY89DRAFT_664277 [Mollisia scopiformis]|uniref:Uncharacterized protein n=1 Tax=Mollisia scopiformis TaxID=149040 RepID=A0A194XQI5_MOLSC|nr:uncharacterized protein LY89DRAFT_664277 [Mollisia scopiformis]KUJ22458.1 hypothetical protein LY89DRAFT_664277 [Mollisia scopiformis]
MSKFRRQGTGTSVRGKPISHPIPFPDDDEFPIRTPGAGIAMPLGTDAENQIRIRESVAAQLENTSHQTGIAVSDFIDPIAAAQSGPVPSQPSPETPVRRTNVPSQLRNSTASRNTGSSGRPQRKKSTMRAVFGRLFGKRRKGSGSSSPKEQGPSEIRAGQHRSDPTALNRSPPASSQKRSASLPINEFNRALRSHSIVADDFPLGSSENEASRGSIQADGQRRPRRATTPSRLWTPNKTPGYVDWTGLSPRPASTHGRGSRVVSDGEDAVAEANIGTAVSSSSHPNRRSRSLGELRDIVTTAAGGPGTQTARRRRSDEIRYWRESYDPGVLSPMSSNKAEVEEPILVDDEGEDARDDEPQEPPQPFVFEMAGMKITQAASLETRVQRLEERMMHMEHMVGSRSFNRASHEDATSMQFQDSPRRGSTSKRSTSITRPQTDNSEISLPRHHRYRDAPRSSATQALDPAAPLPPKGSQNRSSSYGSSRPSTISTHNSYHPSFENFPLSTVPTSEVPLPPNFARPLSTSTTIRGIPSSSPTFTKDGALTGEHYTALTNMILAEQNARHELESVVHTLQRQLQAYLETHSYPTPGLDAAGDPLQITAAGGGEYSSFEQDDEDESSEDEDKVFQTPREERGQFGDEIFGQEERERKSAPRTLSLSQITLGKGNQQQQQQQQHSVNF